MRKNNHTHKYQRFTIGKKEHEIYKCVLPNCNHFLTNTELAIGRESICWYAGSNCEKVVVLTPEIVNWSKMKKPKCNACREEMKERRAALLAIGGTETEPEGEEY